jgi:hypothetical protein
MGRKTGEGPLRRGHAVEQKEEVIETNYQSFLKAAAQHSCRSSYVLFRIQYFSAAGLPVHRSYILFLSSDMHHIVVSTDWTCATVSKNVSNRLSDHLKKNLR